MLNKHLFIKEFEGILVDIAGCVWPLGLGARSDYRALCMGKVTKTVKRRLGLF